MGGHSWDPLHGRGAPENAKWGTGVHNAICGMPPLFPPHSVAFFRATQARGFCHTTPNLNRQLYWIKPISNKLLTTSNPLFLTYDPLFTLLPNLHHYNVNSKPHSECWENSCFVQLGQAKYKSGCLFVAQLIFLIKNANGMQV